MARGACYIIFTCNPVLLMSTVLFGHIEQPIMLWLVLWGTRLLADGRSRSASVVLGLAVLTRSVAILYLLMLFALVFARLGRRTGVWFVGGALGTIALGLLPFIVADPCGLVFSLAGYRSALPIEGGSIWVLAINTPFESLAQHADASLALLGVMLLTGITLVRRQDLQPRSRDMYGLLLLTSICFPLLAKTVWPYYLLDVFVFATIWAWASGAALAGESIALLVLPPSYFVICAALLNYGSRLEWVDGALFVHEGVALFLLLGGFLVAFAAHLWRAPPWPAVPS